MELDKYNALGIVSVGIASRIDNLCKLLIKKGVITVDDLNQLNSDVEKELAKIYTEEIAEAQSWKNRQ